MCIFRPDHNQPAVLPGPYQAQVPCQPSCPLTLADSNPSSWGRSCCKESQLYIPLAKSLAQSWHREKSWDHCASHPLPGVVDPQLLQRTHLVHICEKNSFGKNYLLLSSSFCAFSTFHHFYYFTSAEMLPNRTRSFKCWNCYWKELSSLPSW